MISRKKKSFFFNFSSSSGGEDKTNEEKKESNEGESTVESRIVSVSMSKFIFKVEFSEYQCPNSYLK